MSGIFGQWRLDGSPTSPGVDEEMSRRLAHRGPDGSGQWRSEAITLGHRMLRSTPEAAREVQPLTGAEGAIVVTADLRLDNREELIAALGLDRSPAEPWTDADLVLASYRSWQERAVERWIGDFAVAIWDAPRRRLFCARDPFGVKPLYYHHAPGRLFAFASEIEALFALPEVPPELDDYEIARHLHIPLGGDASPTYYAHVRRVLPAHAMVVREQGLETRRYWSLDPTRELVLSDDREYAEALRESFVEAVRCRLRSDGPIAAMLSGGIDSASIAGVAADLLEQGGGPTLHTLSAVYPRVPESDERGYIDDVLAGHSVVPHFLEADALDPIADIDRVNRLIGGANWGGNLYLNWMLYGIAADAGARVVLDGFDGDTTVSHGRGLLSELAKTGRWLELGRTSVAFSRRAGRPVVSDLLALVRLGVRHPARDTAVTALLRRLRDRPVESRRQEPMTEEPPPGNRYRLLNPEFAERSAEGIVADPNPPTTEREFHWRKLNGLALFEGIGWLDACAAGRGIEVRLPFCDARLVELCLSFPADQKLRKGWTRYAMRLAMEGYLPESIRWRPGKTSLYAGWRRAWTTAQNGGIDALLERPAPAVTRYLDAARVLELHRRFLAGGTDDREGAALWRALSLALWLSSEGDRPVDQDG